MHVVVIGAGPAGVAAAFRAADLGAQTTLIAHQEFGGMAANDGPIPVRTLAHAARLLRDTGQLGRYGITTDTPALDYGQLLVRVREVVADVRAHSALRGLLDERNVTICEHAGHARFVEPHTIETESGLQLEADRVILCTGGTSRRLSLPGFELTATHSDAWSLSAVPPSMLVIGGGATGAQVASIFNDFGTRVQLFQAGPRILPTEDQDVSATVAAAFRAAGIQVHEGFGTIEHFEQTPDGVRMVYAKNGVQSRAEAALAVVAVGWVANTAGLRLDTPGVETDARGFVQVDAYRQTSAPHVFAAGDVTGRLMLVPQAIEDGHTAATNAVRGQCVTLRSEVTPIGSFTDPEYAQVGLTEAKAREAHDVVIVKVGFDQAARMIIDGRTLGFCKLIADRATSRILGCHVVGERAVEIAQTAAIAMAADMRVADLARVPLSFPTYTGILGRAAYRAAHAINPALAAGALQEEG